MSVPPSMGITSAYTMSRSRLAGTTSRTSESVVGQSRRFDCLPPTSALPPSTDIVSSARQVVRAISGLASLQTKVPVPNSLSSIHVPMINVPILTYTELQSDIRWHLHSWRASAFKFSGNLGNDSERIVRERGESHLDRREPPSA
jgi:hypothetical protein